jgi:hypothetical protein
MQSRWWTLLGSAVGISLAFAVWQGLARILPADVSGGLPERLALACAAVLLVVCVLNLMIVVQMRLRVRTGAVDPLAGRDDAWLQVNQRALTNTVEQLAGFVPALLALAAGAASGVSWLDPADGPWPLRPESVLVPVSPSLAPSARDNFAAVSNTVGSSARGRGGRMRMVGALTERTATTWPDASRTGVATVAAPATTSSVVSR